ncbi:alkaline phosphatase family protein [Streptomyces sp. NPDC056628]|uniref:alkaline phosphatase family protein n=1 Tax=Streptomyces sp. NPDC056628 TaxID=3345882 RepID=UPI0036985E62
MTAVQPPAFAATHHQAPAKNVLLISVDGLHQPDLAWYVSQHPNSALARLVGGGVEDTHAKTTTPSDSFPGMVAQATGGGPGTTGLYYDDTYNAALLPAGTTSCKTVKPGAEVDLTEDLDRNQASIDAGQGLTGLPDSLLSMTGNPASLINASKLPVDPKTCKPVYPHSYLKVNTVFEVAAARVCAPRGRTSTRRTRSSTGPRAAAFRTCSRPRSTATPSTARPATTGPRTTRPPSSTTATR